MKVCLDCPAPVETPRSTRCADCKHIARLAVSRRWKERNPEHEQRAQRRRVRDPDEKRATDKASYGRNRTKRQAVNAAWKLANAERHAEIQRAWYVRHAEEQKAQRRAHYAANKADYIRRAAERRARERAAEVERVERHVVWERDGGRCHICGGAADPTDWHLEHVIPLARGGAHSYANVAVSHPTCNLRKGARAA